MAMMRTPNKKLKAQKRRFIEVSECPGNTHIHIQVKWTDANFDFFFFYFFVFGLGGKISIK